MIEEEGSVHEDESLVSLTETLELKNNHEKWLSLMMKKPSQDNINYHLTLFAFFAQEITRSRTIENPSVELIQELSRLQNKEVGILRSLSEKLLKLILEKDQSSFVEILKVPQ